ncbi:sensor histidine kinase [Streptomyces sp. HUAS TT20]|uniref:sensor histidine kinase n=1 Tax=Streptomyces sp. HUAS TT20 TaxID=3447509 RepID=UPI0021DA1BA0|nr:histidine kinase [Streptomyces sp. HUAS 15-9]UXY28888.1 histidine kinase [Streptomyces sp. HUAS 15-9]
MTPTDPTAADGETPPHPAEVPAPTPEPGPETAGEPAPAPNRAPEPARETLLNRLRTRTRRWLHILKYLIATWIALGITLAGGDELSTSYGFNTEDGLLAGFAQGLAVVLSQSRPVPAWGISLAAMVATATAARPALADAPQPGPDWPWATPQVLAHAFVFFVLALRLPIRRAVAALAVSGLATFVVEGVIGGVGYSATGLVAVAVFSVAVLVGTALRARSEARTQLVEQETITAEERARRTLLEERSRIARELHDVVAHHMSVISIQAQVAPHLVENPSEELKENLAGIRQNALEALTELRRVLGVLRSENPDEPAPDSPQPTLDRLDALIENTRAAGLDVVTDIAGEPCPYPPGVELSAYRIVQEALSNVLRHAPGSKVRVEVSHFSEGVHLGVINSRPDRPVPPSPGTGHGLLGMRERATMLGGHVTATPTLHGGFMVTAFLPKDACVARPPLPPTDPAAADGGIPPQKPPAPATEGHVPTPDEGAQTP